MDGRAVYRPGDKYVTKVLVVTMLVFIFGILPFSLFGLIPEAGWTYVFIFLGANLLWLLPTLVLIPVYCRTISYELAEDEVIVRKGLVTRTVKRVPYRMVTNLEVRRGLLDRWLGLGSVALHTAGYSQQTGAEGNLVGLATYDEVHERIVDALRIKATESAAVVDEREVHLEPRSKAETAILVEILHEIRGLRDDLRSAS